MSDVARWQRLHDFDVTPSNCWVPRRVPNAQGYINHWYQGGLKPWHRVTYTLYRGEVEPGLDLDHLCRNRGCCNPWHLEAVTRRVNLERGQHNNRGRSHCRKGHAFTDDNTYVSVTDGSRKCRACRREYQRKYNKTKEL